MKQPKIKKQKEVDPTESQEEHLGSGSLEDKLSYEENLKREIEEKTGITNQQFETLLK